MLEALLPTHLDVKIDALLVSLDDVAPVQKVVIVHHAPREVRLKININVDLALEEEERQIVRNIFCAIEIVEVAVSRMYKSGKI